MKIYIAGKITGDRNYRQKFARVASQYREKGNVILSFSNFAKYIKETKSKIIVYGAGMIGQILAPYILNEYKLDDICDVLLIMDELDAKLHPKLLRYVISMFKNKKINKHGAQLLFTSHDIATMKNTVFRRDEIWFAALNEKHSSEIYSLYEIRREDNERVNSTAAFDKQYLEGRYGADPYLQNMLSGGEWI